MSDLEDTLKKAIRSGLLRITLHRNWTSAHDKGKPEWAASYLHVESNIPAYVDHDDPIEAVELAIKRAMSDIKARREHRREVLEPMQSNLDMITRKNAKKSAIRKAHEEDVKASRKRDLSDLL